MNKHISIYFFGTLSFNHLFCLFQRPPSSSLSYGGPGVNDDVRSPGSGGTPGPLSQAPASQQSLDNSDPGKSIINIHNHRIIEL